MAEDADRVGVVRFGPATGRRRRHHQQPRTHRVTVRFSDEEHQAVERACAMAAQAVWAECRPSDPGEQLDLFTAASLP